MSEVIHTRCCIAGGGPAGIMLGYLLARSGIEVTVLEKWPDFFRDFRGDTIHPSTMTVLHELGLLDDFLKLPHEKTYQVGGRVGGEEVILADFHNTGMRTPFIAFIPQWDFLTFIAQHGKKFPSFHLMMQTEATDLIEENGTVVGVRGKSEGKDIEIRAELVVGADGRHSAIREKAGFKSQEFGVPMDVLWFRVPRLASDPKRVLGTVDAGHLMVMIERNTYWQCAYIIPKGGFELVKAAGLDAFRARVKELASFLDKRVMEIKTWDDVKFLGVTVDRLEEWAREGVVCIGDAAHAMSPIGGVGINLAVQDAVASANILVPAFKRGIPTLADLKKIQKRRSFPVHATQRFQLFVQNQLIVRILGQKTQPRVPPLLRALKWVPILRRVPAYLVGIGVRPEHVRT